MLKKLIALLTALLMLTAPALADVPDLSGLFNLFGGNAVTEEMTEEEAASVIFQMIHEELDADNLQYDTDAETMCDYFSILLETPGPLGDCADMTLYAYWDGVCIEASCREAIDPARFDEIALLCNLYNSSIYIGKFYLREYVEGCYLGYEVFLPMNASYLNEYDRYSIMEYGYFAADMINYYQEYFQMVLDGESANNTYAIWLADSE